MSQAVDTVSGPLTRAEFVHDIVARVSPVVLKGVVSHWPAVAAARKGMAEIMTYLKKCDNGVPAITLLGEPEIRGSFFYGQSTSEVNFVRGSVPISTALDRLKEQSALGQPHTIYVNSAPLEAHLPSFAAQNEMTLVPDGVSGRIWIGNALKAQTHFDLMQNMAVLVAGKRRFTLFAPDQLENLYAAPFDLALAGAPISMVDIDNPDLVAYPRFAMAQQAALIADLEPGDGLYLPYGWWHNVQSYASFNVLVNYWWNDNEIPNGQAYEALLHTALQFRGMTDAQRDFWQRLFTHFAFQSTDKALAHLRPEERGILGALEQGHHRDIQAQLLERMKRQWAIEQDA